jgi:hypothetical protein
LTPDSVHDFDTPGCSRFDGPGEPVALVGLTGEVDPAQAPIPGNDSERLLFRQVYETLVHTDCDFTVRPGLAASWQVDATGTSWIITLRRDARFSDGAAVTARDVIASWMRGGSSLHPEVARFVRTVTALDEVTLSVVLQQQVQQDPARPEAPASLAQPALAVARFVSGSPWPLGTRDVRLELPDVSSSGRTTITLVPTTILNTPATSAPSVGPLSVGPPSAGPISAAPPRAANPVHFLVSPNPDARDLLDQGVDLLLTRDPAALAYATVLAQFDSVPLPWLRSYVFMSRENVAATLAPELRQALADDAVPGEAQGSSYDWAQAWSRCTTDTAVAASRNQLQTPGAITPARIAYDRTDPVARALTERIVALASARSANGTGLLDALVPQARSRKLQMIPLREPDLSSALSRGAEAGFVIALDRSTGCAELARLQARAPWITKHDGVPLVDTRLRAIVRKGRSHMTMEWDGNLLVGGPVRTQ